MDFSLIQQLGVGFLLASLVGLEREKHSKVSGLAGFGGIRTYGLIGLFGGLSWIVSGFFDQPAVVFSVLTAGFLAMMVAAYMATAKKHGGIGGTSEIGAILVYLVGVLSGAGQFFLATLVALSVLSLTMFKQPLHDWVERIGQDELISALQFAIVAFIILPLLPDQGYGPYDFFNPHLIWRMVVFISGLSFASYVAMKLLGSKKGICATGFLAGFISSTALAFSFSRESKRNKSQSDAYLIAIIIASSAMFIRVLIEVIFVNPELALRMAIPLSVMGIVGGLSALFFWIRSPKELKSAPRAMKEKAVDRPSPFSLKPALQFAGFFALILFAVKVGEDVLGDKGLYLTSVLSGFFDVDALTISVSNLAKDTLSFEVATVAIYIGAITNTIFKAGVFMFFGDRKVGLRVLTVFLLMVISGALALFLPTNLILEHLWYS